MEMHPFYQVLDPYLIWFYRLTGHAGVNLVIGTLFLAGLTQILGGSTAFLAAKFTKKHFDRYNEEAMKYHDLSMDALKAGNKQVFKAANTLANDAFGHTFFQQVTLSAAFLWPVFFALAWMQYRFLELEVPIPGTNYSLGFIGVFIPLYFLTYWIIKKIKQSFHSCRRLSPVKDSSGTAYDLTEAG